MERRPTFFTSDWHLGHKNILKPDFDDRPFRDLFHMERVLVNNFNACVPENGITYFLGDMGLCNSETLRRAISQLNGTKILILGNHDKGLNAMLSLGFDVVMHSAGIVVAKHTVTMSHCPLRGVWRENTAGMRNSDGTENWHGEEKNWRFSLPDYGQFHLHGHIHSPNHGKSKKIEGKQYDVGVVANNYRPVSLSMIESWVATYGR